MVKRFPVQTVILGEEKELEIPVNIGDGFRDKLWLCFYALGFRNGLDQQKLCMRSELPSLSRSFLVPLHFIRRDNV